MEWLIRWTPTRALIRWLLKLRYPHQTMIIKMKFHAELLEQQAREWEQREQAEAKAKVMLESLEELSEHYATGEQSFIERMGGDKAARKFIETTFDNYLESETHARWRGLGRNEYLYGLLDDIRVNIRKGNERTDKIFRDVHIPNLRRLLAEQEARMKRNESTSAEQ